MPGPARTTDGGPSAGDTRNGTGSAMPPPGPGRGVPAEAVVGKPADPVDGQRERVSGPNGTPAKPSPRGSGGRHELISEPERDGGEQGR